MVVVRRRTVLGGMLLLPAILSGCGAPATPPASPGSRRTGAADWQAYDVELREQGFSGAVLVAHAGRPVLVQGYGMADRQRGVANTAQSLFCIASTGKMFTAVAIAQLVERGQMAFADPIGKHVSGFPAGIADTVTVHHLLTHTSGMGDALMRGPAGQPPTTQAGLLARIVAEPLQFAPGSRFAYSNFGFIVLGAIIENRTGASYPDAVRQRVFELAGMTDTAVTTYRPIDIPNMAHGYMRVDQNGVPQPPGPGPQTGPLRDNGDIPQIGNPSGGAYSTVADMHAFAQALTGHRLLRPAITETVLAGKVDSDRPGGPPGDRYAYGFSDQKINGVRVVGHNGGTPGYEAQLDVYPETGWTVVVLTNQDGVLVPAVRRSEDMLTRET